MILERLKNETQPQHLQLERDLDLMGPRQSLEHYVDSLRRQHALYAPLEAALFAHPRWEPLEPELFELDGRRKLPLLERDLRYFAVPQPPAYAPIPALRDWPEVLGTLYVLEGATLGGQIIGRQLEARWGLSAECGAAFYRSYGENLGARWKQTRSLLEQELTTPQEMGRAVEAAKATFRLFAEALTSDESGNGAGKRTVEMQQKAAV